MQVIWRTGQTIYACSDTSVATNAFDLETLDSRGHTTVTHDAAPGDAEMPTGMSTGAHRQHVINGSDTIGWVGTLELDALHGAHSGSGTIISVYRDSPIQGEAGEAAAAAPGDGDAPRPSAKRRFIGRVNVPVHSHGLPMIHSFQVSTCGSRSCRAPLYSLCEMHVLLGHAEVAAALCRSVELQSHRCSTQ